MNLSFVQNHTNKNKTKPKDDKLLVFKLGEIWNVLSKSKLS